MKSPKPKETTDENKGIFPNIISRIFVKKCIFYFSTVWPPVCQLDGPIHHQQKKHKIDYRKRT
jgi:hypothetical protein